jgi:hypothetical protein
MPSEQLPAAIDASNDELVTSAVTLGVGGLHPTGHGARVVFSGSERKVIDGPFTESKELVAGYWLWQVKSMDEALEWVKRCPNPMPTESEIELRPVFEAEDFGAELTPELRAQEERQRAEIEKRAKAGQH